MLEQNFQSVYEKFKLQFFRRLFSQVREREGSLSAMEAFSVEVIHELDAPTIGQFADFLGISQSNATYKVNNLIRKGYIIKENSDTDRRERPRHAAVGVRRLCPPRRGPRRRRQKRRLQDVRRPALARVCAPGAL